MKKLIIYSFLLVCTFLSFEGVHAVENDVYIYFNNVDDPVTVQEIQNELTVSDDIDGNITDEIYVVLDNYTENNNIIGDFIVIFGVTDSSGNESTIAITVRNVDVTAPVILVESYRSLAIPQNSNILLNLPLIKAMDGYEGDITDNFVISGISAVDTSVLTDYVLTYTITDSSGNTSTEEITISIVDVIAPILTGVTEIYKKSSHIMSTDDILKYFTASDNIDGDLTSSIVIDVNQYIGNADKPGTYLMVLSVTDSYENKTTYEITIKVIDDMIPLLIIDNYFWIVADNYKLSGIDFIETLKTIGDLPNDTYVQDITLDTYSDSYSLLGSAEFRFLLLSSSGNEYSKSIDLEIIDGVFATLVEDPSQMNNVWEVIVTYWWIAAIGFVVVVGIIKS